MNILRIIFQQTSWQIIGKLVTSISTLIILGIITRNYHERGTGIFTLSLTYLAMFNILGDFGFNAHALKKFQVSSFKFQIEEFRRLLGTRILWSIVLVVFAIGTLPFWPFATNEFSKAVMFGSLAIAGSAIFVTCNLIFQSKLRYNLSVLASSLGALAGLFFYLWLSSKNYPIPFLLVANSVSWMVIAIVSMTLVKTFLQTMIPIFDYQYTKRLFKDSWPIAATLGLNVIYFRVDSFIIAYFKGVSDVGIYNTAFLVFQSALVLPTFIMNAYYPLMLKSLKGIKLVGLGLLVLASLGTLLVIILTPEIIELLTGEGFFGSIQSLQILSLGFPAYFLSSLLMWVLITKGRYKFMLLVYIFGLALNLILNFLYIPQYSFLAASWTTVISEYVILIVQILYFRSIIFR